MMRMVLLLCVLSVVWSKRNVVIDTDIGDDMDDAVALAVALQSPEINILGVTVVGFEGLYRARAAARLIRLSGNEGVVPVHVGEEKPMKEGIFIPPFPYDDGLLWDDTYDEKISDVGSVEAMIGYIEKNPGVDIVMIGPSTNIGKVLDQRPDLADKIGSISIMGGYPKELVWCNRTASWFLGQYNLAADPTASSIIMSHAMKFKVRFIGLQVTRDVWLNQENFNTLQKAEKNSEFLQVLNLALEFFHVWLGFRCPEDNPYVFLHDPLTTITSFNTSFCDFEDYWFIFKVENGVFRSIPVDKNTSGAISIPFAVSVNREELINFTVDRLLKYSQ